MACSTGCPTQNHASFADCMRSKKPRVAYCNSVNGWDATRQKNADKELQAYADAKAEGIQPAGTKMPQIVNAKKISDATGKAYQA